MNKKLYTSKKWLTKRYVEERKSIEEIMTETGATKKTIYIWIEKHGIKR